MTPCGSVQLREHLAGRPLWLCRVDARPWPCPEARLAMARQARADRVALCLYLARSLHDLMDDTYRLHPDTAPEPRALAERVFGWLPPRRVSKGRSDGDGPRPTAPAAVEPASAGDVRAEDD